MASTTSQKFVPPSIVPIWINGKQTTTPLTFDVISPVTQKVLYKASAITEDDAIAAIASAQNALKTWRKTKPIERRSILLKAADLFEQRGAELQEYNKTETGAAETMAAFDHSIIVEACRSAAGLISAITGQVPTTAAPGSAAMLVKEPFGVVYSIAPWNAPLALGGRSVIGPIAMGNTVVLKGPEAAPGIYWKMTEIFHEAGLPAGVLNTVFHRPEDGAKIANVVIPHPAIKKVNFTGSTAVGRSIAALAGKNLKPVLMELGGKAPSIVCHDADLTVAAKHCALGAFLHAGQICMSTERILVHSSIAAEFKETLKSTMDAIFGSAPVPQLVNAPPVAKNKSLLQDAISKGAKVVYGDAEHDTGSETSMKPVILEGVKKGMEIYYTESFGPTVSILTFETEEEALEIANDTDYGLSSAVFSQDLRRAMKIAKEIETGAVHINSMSVHDESALPHGGAKSSGWGRFNGIVGLDEWCRWKTISWDE
ncbi:hypothetical protein R6Q59_010155 [Mikania micrantha]